MHFEKILNIVNENVLFKTNSKEVFDRITSSFPSNGSKTIDASVQFEHNPQEKIQKDLKNMHIYVSYPDIVETLDGYGNINVSKWMMRLVAYSLEKQEKGICFHAGAAEYNGKASLFLGSSMGGKTTTTLSLIKHGFRFINDEYVYLIWDGDKIIATSVPTLYPEVRAGFVLNNEEFSNFREKFQHIKENLWDSEESLSLDVTSIYGKENFIEKADVKNIFLTNLDPKQKSTIEKIHTLETNEKNIIALESIRCLHKLVEAEEIDASKIAYAHENVKTKLDINIEKRDEKIKDLLRKTNIYLVTFGYDIKEGIENIAKIIKEKH